jgi:DNA-binding MarR family transcriptional regulator
MLMLMGARHRSTQGSPQERSLPREPIDDRSLAAEAWRPIAEFFFATVGERQRVLGEFGLTPNDARALMMLDETRGQTMRELAQAWACDASNATWIVDRLEERGLARREAVPSDRRVKSVVLTALGARTRERVRQHLFEPPSQLLELSRSDLIALREAASRLPVVEERLPSSRTG